MSESQQPTNRLRIQLGIVAVVVVVGLVLVFVQTSYQPAAQPVNQPTGNPVVPANLTALPTVPALSEADLRLLGDLRATTQACGDYTDARREQMLQHITWLENPQQIPPDIAFAITLRGSLNGGLIYGMAIFTSTEWSLLERPADSCLIDIGRTLNGMLSVFGETPLTIYDE